MSNIRKWDVDVGRFVEIVAERMYTDPILAGIRELITNSLDARKDKVSIQMDYKDKIFRYVDDGVGIDPKSFEEVYGKIASGHTRKKEARGFFGIGRMALIASSEKGTIMSYYKGNVYTWTFTKDGWTGPFIAKDEDQIGHGVFIQFEGLDIGNVEELKIWVQKTFNIPLLRKECEIKICDEEIFWNTSLDWKEQLPIQSKYGSIQFYTKEETDGLLFICQKGILVKEEPYTGLSAYVDQGFLDIKTDREGFVNDVKYRYFNKVLKQELSKLRPVKAFKKMEVDFIKRLMKDFKTFWEKKVTDVNVMESVPLKIEFPEEGKEVITEEEPKFEEKENDWSKIPTTDELAEHIDKTEGQDSAPITAPTVEEQGIDVEHIEDGTPSEVTPSPESSSSTDEILPEKKEDINQTIKQDQLDQVHESMEKDVGSESLIQEEKKEEPKEEEKVTTIRGAKPVELGEDFPVIYFERDPFVLVFNTTHPVFKKLVESGKLGSHELAVLFERMFECAYTNVHPNNDAELKERWKEVDRKLKDLFK